MAWQNQLNEKELFGSCIHGHDAQMNLIAHRSKSRFWFEAHVFCCQLSHAASHTWHDSDFCLGPNEPCTDFHRADQMLIF
jgi:hypothetical protein